MQRFYAAVCLLLCACPKPMVPGGLDAEGLYAQVQAAHRVPETLSCQAKAIIEAPENSGRWPLHILARRPGSLRLEGLTPLGDPAAILVADQGRFAFADLRNNVFFRGPATPRNLSRLIPAPLTADEIVALITGAVPDLPNGVPQSAKREGDGYVLVLAAPGVLQSAGLGDDLRVLWVRRTSERGDILWEVTLEEHEATGGAQVPRVLHLEAPQAKTKVDLRLRNVVASEPPPANAFQLAPPPGSKIEEVQ